ncbi:TonB-dependent siderophore receptor [Shewanella glacialimarina]|uniref:TonB-dependent siderophore receptor n=1 Tax=Shewanella glacialimarina TaxID=2590884 RepID=UPI001CF859EC|nr:TonB-dependent siderophore receptor [Shewanella glacialimarina]UCX03385.1 TonB-dependent siderophore receptor [Shewanella glacialimarina]
MKRLTLSYAILLALTPISQLHAETPNETQNEAVDQLDPSVETIEVKGRYIQGYNAHSASGASRLDLAISDIPQSVSVITDAQLRDFQLNDINSALDSATGINVERIETDRTYYTARGFDVTNFQIDGVGLPLTSGNNHADEDTAIYDRVEVIRGANGLMTGVGNPSATVNFIRKRPTDDNQLNMLASYGSWDNLRLEVDGTAQLNDTVTARVVAVKQTKDSYLDRYKTDKTVLYAFIDAKFTDDTSLSISHSYIDNDAKGNNWGALPLYYTDGSPTNYDRSTNTSANWSNWQVEKQNTVVELSHYFSDNWRLRATYSHKVTDEDTELFYVFGTPNKTTELGLTGYGSEYDLDENHNLADIYINGDVTLFGREHQIVTGINYAQMDYTDTSLYDYSTGNGFPAMPDLNTWDGNTPKPTFKDDLRGSDVSATQKAAYFTGRFNLFEDFYVIAGGRYNDWQAAGESYGNVQDVEDAQFIPYLGMTYRFIPELLAYASYTETFTAQRELDINDNTLAPVTGESQEVGLKSELFNGNLITTLAYFDIQQTNLAMVDPRTSQLPPTERRYIGSDGISSNGFELDIAGEIYPGLNASIGYTDFDIKGNDQVAAYTPSKLFKFAATYDLALIEGLTFGLNMRWQDDIQRSQGVVGADVINAGQEITTHQKAYAIVDLMAKYHFTDSLDLTVNANNVTDEKYLTSLYWAQGFYGAPANYSATMSWRL